MNFFKTPNARDGRCRFVSVKISLVAALLVTSSLSFFRGASAAPTLATAGYVATGTSNYDIKDIARKAELAFEKAEKYPYVGVISPDGAYAYFGTSTTPGIIIKVDLATFARVGSISLNSGENQITVALMSPDGAYAYFGTSTIPGRVVKVDLATFARVGSISFNSGENQIAAALISSDGAYAYFGTGTSPGRVVKVDLATFARVSAVTFNTGENSLTAAVLSPNGAYAYFGTSTSAGRVVKMDLSNFTRVSAVTLNTGENTLKSAVISSDGATGYFGTGTATGIVVKVNLSAMTRTSAVTLSAGEGSLASAHISSDGVTAYFLTSAYATIGKIVKVNVSAMTRVSALSLNAEETFMNSMVVSSGGDDAYVVANKSPGVIVKIRLSSMSRTGSLAFTPGDVGMSTYAPVISPDGAYAYFSGTTGVPFSVTDITVGRIVKIDLATFARAGSLDSSVSNFVFGPGVISPDGAYAYFGSRVGVASVGNVKKIDLSTFSEVASLPLSAGETQPVSALISPDGAYAYFGTSYAIPGRVVKIDLVGFTRVSAVTLSTGENDLPTAVISPDGAYAYFASYTSPSKIVKVDLASMARVSALTLDAGENNVASYGGGISPDGTYGYFGTSTGIVVKVNLPSMSRVSAVALNAGETLLGKVSVSPDGAYGYVGTTSSPGRVVKVDLSAMSRISGITLDTGENNAGASFVAIDGVHAYFGTAANVIKFALASQAGYVKATKIVLSEYANIVESFSFRSLAATGNVRVALYDDSAGKDKIWESSSFAVSSGLNTVLVSSGTPDSLSGLAAGNYYLSFQVDSIDSVPSFISGISSGGVSGDGLYVSQSYGLSPSDLSAATVSSERFSMAMNYYPLEAPPNLVSSNVGLHSLTVSWDAVARADGYNVYRDGVKVGEVTSLAGTSFDDTGLSVGTQYSYVIRAFKGLVESADSAALVVSTLSIGVPSNLAYSDVTASSLTVSWSAVAGADGYNVYRDGAKVNGATPLAATSFGDSGLVTGTPYSYVVRTVRDSVESQNSIALPVSTLSLGAASALSVSSPTVSTLSLSWAAGVAADAHEVYRNGVLVATVSMPSVTYVDTGLVPGVSYSYEVVAKLSSVSSSATSPVTGTTLTVPTSASLSVSNPTTSSLTISWNAAGGATGYELYRNGAKIADLGTDVSYLDANLNNSTTYSYYLKTKIDSYVSDASASVSGTTRGAVASSLSFLGIGANASGAVISPDQGQLPASSEISTTNFDVVMSREKALLGTIDAKLSNRLKGRILIQVEERGEAWYVSPNDGQKSYLKDGPSAYAAMKSFGLGITDADLKKVPAGEAGKKYAPLFSSLIKRLSGTILIQVQQKGEAWYVNPTDGRRYYMKDGAAAFDIMRSFGLGITNADLRKIPLAE